LSLEVGVLLKLRPAGRIDCDGLALGPPHVLNPTFPTAYIVTAQAKDCITKLYVVGTACSMVGQFPFAASNKRQASRCPAGAAMLTPPPIRCA
jgi:hypothetical protein